VTPVNLIVELVEVVVTALKVALQEVPEGSPCSLMNTV
jgi:hypothetical protein